MAITWKFPGRPLPDRRSIDGETWSLDQAYDKREDARTRAEWRRGQDMNARVVFSRGRWGVYVR